MKNIVVSLLVLGCSFSALASEKVSENSDGSFTINNPRILYNGNQTLISSWSDQDGVCKAKGYSIYVTSQITEDPSWIDSKLRRVYVVLGEDGNIANVKRAGESDKFITVTCRK